MTHRPREISESGVYHVTARGIGRQIIFEDDGDRRAFVESMRRLRSECRVEVLAWCLMENHVHLMLRGEIDGVSLMMRRLLGSYAMRFNSLHGRVGHLFQDRFHSKPVKSDEQMLATLRYIHLNPLEAGFDFQRYPWSSYGAYATGSGLADTAFLLDVLGGREAFAEFHGGAHGTAVAPTTGNAADAFRRAERRRMSAGEVDETLRSVLGTTSPYELKSLGKAERDAYIARHRQAGLSVRQKERATGIGRGIVSRVRANAGECAE